MIKKIVTKVACKYMQYTFNRDMRRMEKYLAKHNQAGMIIVSD